MSVGAASKEGYGRKAVERSGRSKDGGEKGEQSKMERRKQSACAPLHPVPSSGPACAENSSESPPNQQSHPLT